MHFQTVLAISAFITAALATPVDVVGKRQTQIQACGNGLSIMCCDTFQTELLFGFIPIQIGTTCNSVSSSVDCSQNVACCQTGSQTGLINIGAICPQVNV